MVKHKIRPLPPGVARPVDGESAPAPGSPRPQMADVARLAGVSTTTVSRALGHSPLVNDATRRRVRALAQSLQYTVHAGAKSLRLGRPDSVAVVVLRGPDSQADMADPIMLGLLASAADALAALGHDMLVALAATPGPDAIAAHYDAGRARGILVLGWGRDQATCNALAQRGVPLAVWGAAPAGQLYRGVACDDHLGGLLATRFLLARGRRRIAFLGDTRQPEAARRFAGYRDACAEAGLKQDPALALAAHVVAQGGHAAALALLAQAVAFDAVFACSDLLAITAIGALRESGLAVPEDVSVVGYDDLPIARHFHPPLTTVRQPIEAGGRALVACLLGGREETGQLAQLLPPELVVRGSA